ncbi:hypothetical protein [aff. Roholtiella sp. LEGE 12411]|nr:hypothetical protein [aff. Roholtiella sp. LEGE 12411]
MNKILFLDLDGTVRRTKSGAKFSVIRCAVIDFDYRDDLRQWQG